MTRAPTAARSARRALETLLTLLALAPALLGVSCAHPPRHDPGHDPRGDADPPHLDAASPDSVLLVQGGVVEVRLTGRGFAPGTPGRNTVRLGPVTLNHVPANTDGTELRFVIPELVSSGGEAPPSPLPGGTYSIVVRTASGDSNPLTLRVFR